MFVGVRNARLLALELVFEEAVLVEAIVDALYVVLYWDHNITFRFLVLSVDGFVQLLVKVLIIRHGYRLLQHRLLDETEGAALEAQV